MVRGMVVSHRAEVDCRRESDAGYDDYDRHTEIMGEEVVMKLMMMVMMRMMRRMMMMMMIMMMK